MCRDVVAFCKQELATNPLAGPLLRQVETIFVDRGAEDQSGVLRQALAVLASGRSLVIAPEGTRQRTPALGRVVQEGEEARHHEAEQKHDDRGGEYQAPPDQSVFEEIVF